MRPTADLLFEHQMNVVTGHHSLVVFGGAYSENLQPLDQAALDKLDRLEGAIGLFGKHHRDVPELALAVGQRAIAEIGEDEPGADRDRGYQQSTAKNKQSGYVR